MYTDSPYYKYLKGSPLKEVEYVNAGDFKLIQNKHGLKINNWVKHMSKKLVGIFYPSMLNVHLTRTSEKYDLIHCAHCISKNKSPWVCDIEFVGQFWVANSYRNLSSKKKVLQYLMSPYCKKILAWTEWTKKGILKELPEVKGKLEVLYPAVPFQKIKKRSYSKINLLFVGRNFELKGGMIALDIFDKLTKKYNNVSATIVSDVPDEIIKKHVANKKIEFHKLMSHEKLFGEIYPKADIFVYPTFSDTFGFAILEAQSFGLPVVAMKTRNTHTIEETISEGKTGFIVNSLGTNDKTVSPDIIKQLTRKTEVLIKNKKKLRDMSKNCIMGIKIGKFSIKIQNEKLKRIYKDAMG